MKKEVLLTYLKQPFVTLSLAILISLLIACFTSCRKEQVIISPPPVVHTDTVLVQPPAPHKCGTIFFSVGAIISPTQVNFLIKVRWEDGTENTINITGLYNQYQVGQLYCI